nr:RsmB/NOP family class I SAM-dependent RNA methyltransferase [Clostridioides difficile]
MTKLPKEFLEDVEEILKDEYDDFIKSYEESKTTGLRINTLKIDKKKLFDLGLFDLNQISWAEEGFYYDDKIDRPGRNPLHEAGAYYLQEPSAMSVIPKADIKEGEKVLDMCAAPGGKSTYILSKLNDTGLLVSNEINVSRIKALGENLERFGARNCIITNTDSNSLRKTFNGYFDKVIIDAPCSGQGMFRKDEVAISDWSHAKVVECQSIQKEIIRDGYKMLKKDGILIYSTCTFSREENEHVINEFISEYPHAELIEMERLWPHKIKGEGHFVAKIKKLEEEECNVKELKIKNLDKEIKDYREFEKKFLKVDFYSNKKINFI